MSFARPPQQQSIDEIRDWYEGVVESLLRHRAAIHEALRNQTPAEPRFVGMDADDVDAFFGAQRSNLDQLTIMNLVASAEAELRKDYGDRVAHHYKDILSRTYAAFHRTLSPSQKARPPFDGGGILEQLKQSGAVPAHLVTNFRDALRLRHWIAHGRYWTQPLAHAAYIPDDVYRTIFALASALPT
jgi:hypothetical protein